MNCGQAGMKITQEPVYYSWPSGHEPLQAEGKGRVKERQAGNETWANLCYNLLLAGGNKVKVIAYS